MKAMAPDLNAPVDPRFGRAPFYLIVDTENLENVQSLQNPYIMMPSGAGIAAAQLALQQGVQLVFATMLGPNAAMVLATAGIQFIPMPPGLTARQAIEDYKAGKLQVISPFPSYPYAPAASFPTNEREYLENQLGLLQNQMEAIKKRLEELKTTQEIK